MNKNLNNFKTAKYMKDIYGNKSSIRVTLHNPPSEDFTEMFVPVADDNSDYEDILAWVEAGELTIEESD